MHKHLKNLMQWSVLCVCIASFAGFSSAAFLKSLDLMTQYRLAHPWLINLLPVSGWVCAWLYLRYGQNLEAGTQLLKNEIRQPQTVIPLRMAPLIFLSTSLSHLSGASVGREGAAVQLSGSLSDQLSKFFDLTADQRRLLLVAAISAGFAAVFGTPVAATVFGLEIAASAWLSTVKSDAAKSGNALKIIQNTPFSLLVKSLKYSFFCLLCAQLANQVCLLLAVQHAHYAVSSIDTAQNIPPFYLSETSLVFVKLCCAAVCFGVCARVFSFSVKRLLRLMQNTISYAPLRSFTGGILMLACVWLFGTENTQKYLGLGLPTLADAFLIPLPGSDFICKMGVTIVSIGTGFKGGEVTPLFYIGATLGNALAPMLELPFDSLAALGFVAVFAGVSQAPVSSAIMAIELFGMPIGFQALMVCCISFMVTQIQTSKLLRF